MLTMIVNKTICIEYISPDLISVQTICIEYISPDSISVQTKTWNKTHNINHQHILPTVIDTILSNK